MQEVGIAIETHGNIAHTYKTVPIRSPVPTYSVSPASAFCSRPYLRVRKSLSSDARLRRIPR